jgi:hypothetical protein
VTVGSYPLCRHSILFAVEERNIPAALSLLQQ